MFRFIEHFQCQYQTARIELCVYKVYERRHRCCYCCYSWWGCCCYCGLLHFVVNRIGRKTVEGRWAVNASGGVGHRQQKQQNCGTHYANASASVRVFALVWQQYHLQQVEVLAGKSWGGVVVGWVGGCLAGKENYAWGSFVYSLLLLLLLLLSAAMSREIYNWRWTYWKKIYLRQILKHFLTIIWKPHFTYKYI